jgi:hypothetical protein
MDTKTPTAAKQFPHNMKPQLKQPEIVDDPGKTIGLEALEAKVAEGMSQSLVLREHYLTSQRAIEEIDAKLKETSEEREKLRRPAKAD